MSRKSLLITLLFVLWHGIKANEALSAGSDDTPSKPLSIAQWMLLGNNNPTNLFCIFESENKDTSMGLIVPSATEKIITLTSDTVSVNYTSTANPLTGQHIQLVGADLDASKPWVITQEIPNQPYMLEGIVSGTIHNIATPSSCLYDSNGQPAHSILKMVGISGLEDDKKGVEYTVAAVRGPDGTFGGPASGFALIKNQHYLFKTGRKVKNNSTGKEEDEEIVRYECEVKNQSETISEVACAAPIDYAAFSIADGLDYLEPDALCLYADKELHRVYIGVYAKAKDTATDQQGVRSLAIGRVCNNKIFLDPIATDEFFNAASYVLGSTGRGAWSCVHALSSMNNSGGYKYLLVAGAHDKELCKRMIFSFPVTDRRLMREQSCEKFFKDAAHGTITTSTASTPSYNYDRFNHRFINDQADAAGRKTVNDTALLLGNEVLPADIVAITSRYDAVYVTVKFENDHSAVFHTQAIIDEQGLIAGWTSWQQVTLAKPNILAFKVENQAIRHSLLKHTAGNTNAKWEPSPWISDNDSAQEGTLQKTLKHLLQEHKSRIEAVEPFQGYTPGIGDHSQSGFIIVGTSCISLVQPSHTFKQWNTDAHYVSHDGSLQTKSKDGYGIITLAGGALEAIAPLRSAAIVTDEQQAWLMVGGKHGIALLADQDGNGWPKVAGMGYGFVNLSSSLCFRLVSNMPNVKKIINSQNRWYCVTDTQCCTMQYEESVLNPRVQVLHTHPRGIYDAAVSYDTLLIATPDGLLKNEVSLEQLPQAPEWSWVDSTEGKRVYKLYFATKKDCDTEFDQGSQLYTIVQGPKQCTHIYRYYAHNNTVKKVNDIFFKDESHPFMEILGSTKLFFTDGHNYVIDQLLAQDREQKIVNINPYSINKTYQRSHIMPFCGDSHDKIKGIARDHITGSIYSYSNHAIRIHG